MREVLPHLLLAVQDDQLVGCCQLDGHGHFGMFAVRPGLQGSGTGGLLLAHAEGLARARGCEQVELQVLSQRTELIAYYVRRGYRRTGEQRPFPYGDERFGRPRRDDLAFDVLVKSLA